MGFTIWAEATARDINALLTLHKVHPQVRADVKRRLNALVEKSYEELESLQPCYNESPENICGAIAEDIFRRTIDVAIPLAQLRDEERKCSELQQELSDLRLSAKKANDRCGHTEAVLIDLKQAHDYMLHSYFREVLILRHRVDELQRRGSGAPSPPTRSKTRGFPQYRRATDSSRDQTQRQTTFGDAIQIAEKSDSDDRANSDDAPSSPRKSEGTNHPDSEAQIVNSLGPYAKYFQQNGISDAKSMLQCIAAKYEESIDAIFDYERYLGILNKSAGSWEDRYNAVCEENEELSQQLEKERAKTRSMRYADMDRDETISFLERKLEDARLLTEKYQLYLHLATGPVRVQLTDLLDEIRNEVGIMRAEHLRQMSLVKDAMVELQNRSEALLDFFLTYVQGAGEIIHNIKLDAAAKTLDELNSIPVASTTKVMSFFAIQDSGHRMKWSKKIVGAQPDFNEDPDAFYSTDGLSFWSYHPITRSAFSTFSELHDLVEKLRKRKAHAISQGSLLKGKKARDASYDYGDDYHVPAGVDVPATRSGTSVVSTADAPAGLSSDIPRTAAEPTPAGTTTTTDSSASRPQSKNAVANRADSSAAAGKAEPSLPATLLSEKESVDRHRTPSAGLGSSTASKQLPARDSLELYARTNSSSSRRVGGTPSTALRISPAGEWKQKNVDGANGMTGSDILKELVHLRLRRAVNNKRLAHCSNCVNLVELPMNAEFRERLQTVADTIDKRIVEDSERIAELLGLLQSHMDKFNQQRRDAIQQALEARKREDEERKEEARRLLECKTAMEQARASFFTPYLHSPTKKKCVSFDNKGDLLGGYVIFNGELVPISSFFLERAKWDTEEPDAPSHPQYVRGQGRTPYAAVMDYCTGVQLGMPMGSTRGPVYLEHDPETSNFFVADEKGKNILLEASKNHEEHEAVRLPPSEGVMPLTQIIVPAPMPLIDRHARNADTQMAAMNALMSDGYLFYYDPDAPKTEGTWQPRSFPDVLEPVYLVPMCNPVTQEETADMHPKEQLCDSDVYTTSSAPIPLSSATNTLIGSSYSYGLPPRVCRPYANEPMLQIRALGAPGYDAQGERQPHPPSHEVNTEGTIGGFSSALARAKLLRTARLLKEEQDQTEDRERRKEDWQQRMQYQEPTKKEKYLRLRLPRIASSFPDPSETAKLQQKLWPQSSKKRLDSHSEQRVDGAEP